MREFPPRISLHAVERWQQRIDPDTSFETASLELSSFVRDGRSRPTPRRWMRDVKRSPGLRFIYSQEHPGVCVLVQGDTALTVLTRSLCRSKVQLSRGRRSPHPVVRRNLAYRRCNRMWAESEEAA